MLADNNEGMTPHLERAVRLADQLGAELTLGMSYGNLGMQRLWQGHPDEALELHVRAIQPLIAADHTATISYTLLNSAEALWKTGQPDEAAKLIGLSQHLLEQLKVLPISLMETRRARIEHDMAEEMGQAAFEAAVSQGAAMSIEEALGLMRAGIRTPA
jgi:hypothetical protein